jgi:hypothetical protein
MEGNHCYNPPENCNDGSLVLPVFEYDHPTGFSVIGGYVYRGSAIPAITGHYFFADWVSNFIWSFRIQGGEVVELTDWTGPLSQGGEILNVTGFGEDASGEIYFVLPGSGSDGEVRKIIPDGTAASFPPSQLRLPQLSRPRPNPFTGSTELTLQLPHSAHVRLSVMDISGRLVRSLGQRVHAAGSQPISWDGKDELGRPLPAGIYLIRAVVADVVLSSRVTLIR